MSAASHPIDPQRFREALVDLPLSSLHAKAAEIRNSVQHLQSSNEQLQPFAESGDTDCADAVNENLQVIERMRFRLEMLKEEVENRGMMWVEDSANGKPTTPAVNGEGSNGANGESLESHPNEVARDAESGNREGERRGLSDEELARRVRERLDEEHGGMHL